MKLTPGKKKFFLKKKNVINVRKESYGIMMCLQLMIK